MTLVPCSSTCSRLPGAHPICHNSNSAALTVLPDSSLTPPQKAPKAPHKRRTASSAVLAANTPEPNSSRPSPRPSTCFGLCSVCAIPPSPPREIDTDHPRIYPGAIAVAPTPHASLTSPFPRGCCGHSSRFPAQSATLVVASAALDHTFPGRSKAHFSESAPTAFALSSPTTVPGSSTEQSLCMPADLHDHNAVLRRTRSAAHRRAAA